MNDHLHLSPNGARFIADFEGCILHPYNDPWNATIGIGHLIHMGRVTDHDVLRWHGFTYAKAVALFQSDIISYEDEIKHAIHVPLSQNEFDALCSLVYNTGPGVLSSGVARDINAGHKLAATQAWQSWCHGNGGVVMAGLVRRRRAEQELFLKRDAIHIPYVPADELRWEREWDQHQSRARRAALRRRMTARRQEIYHLAQSQSGGWDKANRRARYNALRGRTLRA